MDIEQIGRDVRTLLLNIRNIKEIWNSPITAEDLKQQLSAFLKDADSQVENLNKNINELEALRLELAEYFCEDLKCFKLEECFGLFRNFCKQFEQAVQDNVKRLHLEQKQKLKEEQQMKKNISSGE